MHIYAWSAICWSTHKCNMLINACPLHIYLYLYRSSLIMKWFNKTRIDLSHIMYNWLCKFWMPFWYARGRNKLAFILIKVKTRPFFPNEKRIIICESSWRKLNVLFPKHVRFSLYRFVPVCRVHTSPYNTVYIAYDLKYWDQSAFMCKINHILLKQYEFTILCSINSIFCDAWFYQFYLQFKVLTVSMYLRIC